MQQIVATRPKTSTKYQFVHLFFCHFVKFSELCSSIANHNLPTPLKYRHYTLLYISYTDHVTDSVFSGKDIRKQKQ